MRIYRVSITGDKYATEYNIEASSWRSGIGRAVQEWQKRFKGSRTGELKIRAIKSSSVLRTNDNL